MKSAMLPGFFFGIIAIFKVIILALYPFVCIHILLQKNMLLESPFAVNRSFDAHDSADSHPVDLAKLSGFWPTLVAVKFRLGAEVRQ